MRRTLTFAMIAAVGTMALTAGWPMVSAQAGKATATRRSLQERIVLKERQELDTLKSGNAQEFASLIADEAVFVDQRGTAGKAEVVAHVTDFKLLEYTMEDIKFVPLSARSGVIAYKLVEKASAHGREFTATAYASAVWAERDGKLVCVFSQETPAK
ncbi:MAG TPA: nuclear transport factor 2 family protein [Verrucomicrobiae bacterium]|nr:nuclear transport factor 2 family protein [Verrucomicrobiae bacterium]